MCVIFFSLGKSSSKIQGSQPNADFGSVQTGDNKILGEVEEFCETVRDVLSRVRGNEFVILVLVYIGAKRKE